MFAEKMPEEPDKDIFKQTLGAWKRHELIQRTIKRTREAFRRLMRKRQKSAHS
jgi:hypothetical protein